jgi:cold shock CspA family protein
MRRTGQLRAWKSTFGFFQVEGLPDVFCHVTSFEHCEPLLDRFYEFDIEPDPRDSKRVRANNITRLENREDESEHRKSLEVELAYRSLPMLKPERAGGSGLE